MGAIQVFARRRRLERVDYLSVVSGGSYFGGAHQMLRAHGALDPDRVQVSLDDAYEPGSPEEDWVRRHGKYIADGSQEWLMTIGVVARNVLLGLTLISATLVVAAGVLGGDVFRRWQLGGTGLRAAETDWLALAQLHTRFLDRPHSAVRVGRPGLDFHGSPVEKSVC